MDVPIGAALPNTPPTPPSLAVPPSPFASLLFIDERIHLQRGQEEASARWLTFELNQGQLYASHQTFARSGGASYPSLSAFTGRLDPGRASLSGNCPTGSPTLLSEFTARTATSCERAVASCVFTCCSALSQHQKSACRQRKQTLEKCKLGRTSFDWNSRSPKRSCENGMTGRPLVFYPKLRLLSIKRICTQSQESNGFFICY